MRSNKAKTVEVEDEEANDTEPKEREGRRIRGTDATGTLFEWYGESGGQLKYYPLAETAVWSSPLFQLEPLPLPPSAYGLLARVKQYYPEKWGEAGG